MSNEAYFSRAKFCRSFGLIEQVPPFERPEIVLSGRSNVGKSSLLNRLCYQKSLARESSTPGKTITVNYFELPSAYIVDLPGYGFAKRSAAEQERFAGLCDGYAALEGRRRLYLQLIDVRRGLTADDEMMLNYLYEKGENFLAIVTKVDKLNKTGLANATRDISYDLSRFGCNTVFTGAKTSVGYDLLREYIMEFIEKDD